MHVVIFEVRPKPGCREEYLGIAAELRAELEKTDGFIAVERFASLVDEDKVLSLSTWRDEAALIAWREQAEHRLAQMKGRNALFADYRIRVAKVERDYGLDDRADAPFD